MDALIVGTRGKEGKMRYYKLIAGGYLEAIGTGEGGTEITEEEYNSLLGLIRNRPAAPDATHDYWITEGGEYELVEVEPLPEPSDDDELTEDPPAWDIMQGQQIAVGDEVSSLGVVYVCIKSHTAAWSKQPPNDEYWEVKS